MFTCFDPSSLGIRAVTRGQFRDSQSILSRGFYAAYRCSRPLRRAILASTSRGGKRHRELGGKKVGNYRPKAVTGEPVIEYPTEDLNPDDLPF